MRTAQADGGKLRIGDDWNAIRIIALSQSNPLKAIAEFVENSIDARATTVTITRGREHGQHYLAIRDDGEGVPRDAEGRPDFKYVATHIGDSIKRRLKSEGKGTGLQGEFGIGLLSFWTVGEQLTMSSAGADERVWQMTMRKGDARYALAPRRTLFGERGTELKIAPLLEGVRGLSGEKIQWYLASELRDRIRESKVRITVIDRNARKQYAVEPRRFEGRLLHGLPAVRTPFGEAYAELYLGEPADAACVALTRLGTRVLEDVSALPGLDHAPWTLRYVQGLIDAPFLTLTPGTRSGIVHDERHAALAAALEPLEAHITRLIDAQRRAEEEQASQQALKAIQKAFHEAMLALPPEEYDWFDVQRQARRGGGNGLAPGEAATAPEETPPDEGAFLGVAEPGAQESPQRQFFEFAGPLFAVVVSPAASTVATNTSRTFRALPRDRSRRSVTEDLSFAWSIVEGEGSSAAPGGAEAGHLRGATDQQVVFHAPSTPGLTRLRVTVAQRDVQVDAEALITVADRLDAALGSVVANTRGLPGYTFERAAGELWRSRFDAERNVIVVNNGHRDFVFATRNRALQLRYLVKLYVKELVLRNFAGASAEQLLERAIELSLYAEEKLRSASSV